MSSTDETDAREKEYSTENKVDKYLFYIAHASAWLHEIHCSQDQSCDPEKGQYDANNSLFHQVFSKARCKRYASLDAR